jgi:NADH-quinone oxidoreductase subunit N
MVIGSFGVATVVGRRGDSHHGLDDYRGLSARRPMLALAFAVFLLSQAGVPFTAGFFGKFYVLGAAVHEGSWHLALIAMVSAVIAAYLYLRIIVAMYMSPVDGDDAAAVGPQVRVPIGAGISLAVALVFTIVVGVLPGLVEEFARDAVPALVATGG